MSNPEPNLFDLPAGIREKEEGQNLVETHTPDFVDTMREAAKSIALSKGTVTADDLRSYGLKNGLRPHHPNAWGAIFKGSEWRTVGYTRSALVSNHARTIRIWTLTEQNQ